MPAPIPGPDETLLNELHALALATAKRAGAFLHEGLLEPREALETKSTGTDMVSEMDRGAERLIADAILAARPHDGLLGEEGADRRGTTGVRWVIDPLDGTTNYLYAQPLWAVSIGVEWHGRGIVGVVDAPMLRETFHAVAGRGAWCNERPIGVGACTDLGFALVGTGFGYRPERRAEQGDVVRTLLPRFRDIRRGGSAAVDLAFVAAGRLDGYYERGLNAWDNAAGTVIVREAGGVVTGLSGEEPDADMTIAANPFLHDVLRAQIVSALNG